jgi:transcriptional regulator with XRE-family HTH domain
MSQRSEITEFLRSRRARISPGQAGLPIHSARRRVPGLRREEVALLAAISPDYYNKIERGAAHGVSPAILGAIADVLQLTFAEREYLVNLVGGGPSGGRARRLTGAVRTVRPTLQRTLDAVTGAPAIISNHISDLVAANHLGRALFSEVLEAVARQPNFAVYDFLDPRARDFHIEWEATARQVAAMLRTEWARRPRDRDLRGLIDELVAKSATFADLWAERDVRYHLNGVQLIRHPVAGVMELSYESMELPADAGLVLTVYTAAPESTSADAIAILASGSVVTEPEPVRADPGLEPTPTP